MKNVTIQIQQGLPEDAKKIREEVFMKEQGFQNEFDETDKTAWTLVLYDNGTAAGCCQLLLPEDGMTAIIRRVAVPKAFRGKSYGSLMLREAEHWLRQHCVQTISLSAQVRVRPFYEQLGFTAVGQEYLDEWCPHIKMEKQVQG